MNFVSFFRFIKAMVLMILLSVFLACSEKKDAKENSVEEAGKTVSEEQEEETKTKEQSSTQSEISDSPTGEGVSKAFIVKCNCIRDGDRHISLTYGSGEDMPSARNDAHQFCVKRGFVEKTSLGVISETYTFQHDSCLIVRQGSGSSQGGAGESTCSL